MTQEEKAKAYDRVSKEVKDFFEGRQKMYSDVEQTLEYLFPELKESEDEKIRKWLIGYFQRNKVAEVIKTHDILAWLEKQDNCSIKWNKNTEDNKPQVNHSVLIQTSNGVAEGEWTGEQWFQYRWSCWLKDNRVRYWAKLSDFEKQCENKE